MVKAKSGAVISAAMAIFRRFGLEEQRFAVALQGDIEPINSLVVGLSVLRSAKYNDPVSAQDCH